MCPVILFAEVVPKMSIKPSLGWSIPLIKESKMPLGFKPIQEINK